jgi:hypothetical protein
MTGVEINQIYSQQIGQTYSGIEDITKKNRRFKKALINAIEEKYRNLNEQREFDELRNLISSQELTPTNNYIDFNTSNTSHVLAVKAKYKRTIPGLTIRDITNASPIVLDLFTPNNIRTGDTILLENVQGNTAANGEFTAIVKNRFKIELYTANGPTAGNGQFVQSPLTTISRVFYNYCQFLKSDEKISSFKGATEDFPLYEIRDGAIYFYPYAQGSIVPSKITIDQINTVTIDFDLSDDTINYSLTYPDKFIYHVINLAAKDFDITFRDYQNSQATDQQILLNP